VVFGVFVCTLYFALLSFVSFLAVSSHRAPHGRLLSPYSAQQKVEEKSRYNQNQGPHNRSPGPGAVHLILWGNYRTAQMLSTPLASTLATMDRGTVVETLIAS
jgi:hypothetical protein